MVRPNGLPISRRKRLEQLSKYERSRARSGRLHGRVSLLRDRRRHSAVFLYVGGA
jgi:hypothetical protein